MKTVLFQIATFLALMAPQQPTMIPKQLWGKWVVTRAIATRTIGCWGDAEAKSLLGTQLEYSRDLFRWKNVITKNPKASSRVIGAEEFHDENSAVSANGSQVDFKQLGLNAKEVVQIEIDHAPAEITGSTVEIPGDHVLLKDNNTIILSACSVYFEARRITAKQP